MLCYLSLPEVNGDQGIANVELNSLTHVLIWNRVKVEVIFGIFQASCRLKLNFMPPDSLPSPGLNKLRLPLPSFGYLPSNTGNAKFSNEFKQDLRLSFKLDDIEEIHIP